MERRNFTYILLNNCDGNTLEYLQHPIDQTSFRPKKVLRGELLRVDARTQQPTSPERIALTGIARNEMRLECRTNDVFELSNDDANLLRAIPPLELRYETFINKLQNVWERISRGSTVFVSIKEIPSSELLGIVRYKGELMTLPGTWFGVELIKNKGLGTCDGTYEGKRYFESAPNSGVFVTLDKLIPVDLDQTSSKQVERDQADVKSRLCSRQKARLRWEGTDGIVKIGQRVGSLRDPTVRGTVRYIGQERDSGGKMQTFVGLELDEKTGIGTGKRNRKQLFVCPEGYPKFVYLDDIMLEEVIQMPYQLSSRGKPLRLPEESSCEKWNTSKRGTNKTSADTEGIEMLPR
ncbi:ubiquitin carboxyl-terminal hydrolase CYLD-like [Stylophora pistillata]|uniref:ubiquitin carboxyl-terminal hydrolase CYLD-like n=1 Tax=Stylophora pistillata TaxID=50429 RepID=UPI000C04EA22|nr:ubiquitin carboxyl-terminal hydrolase CYLD-like [Stylophora pistillata]